MALERIARAVKRSWNGWVWGKENALQVLGARNAAAAAEGNAPSVQKDAKKPTQTAKPYSLFVKDRFQVVRREHPLDDFQTTASRLGELWRKMDRVEKERYARLARIGWEKQAALWASAHPKRKPSAYANFVKVRARFRAHRTGRTDASWRVVRG